jgi:hypothetical protein
MIVIQVAALTSRQSANLEFCMVPRVARALLCTFAAFPAAPVIAADGEAPIRPVSIELSLPKTTYQLGEAIPVSVSVINNTTLPIRVDTQTYYCSISMSQLHGATSVDVSGWWQTSSSLLLDAIPAHGRRVAYACSDLREVRLIAHSGVYEV